jgi:hypothetical protein
MDIDLPPKDYVSEREKPREPIFGPGLPGALAYVISLLVTLFGIYYAIHGHF